MPAGTNFFFHVTKRILSSKCIAKCSNNSEFAGHICYYNEDGQFFFVERINELIRCMGVLVDPSLMESVLLNHGEGEEAVVTRVPHHVYQEAAVAVVVLTTDSRITEEDLKKFVAGEHYC